jgi:hypothetical protein
MARTTQQQRQQHMYVWTTHRKPYTTESDPEAFRGAHVLWMGSGFIVFSSTRWRTETGARFDEGVSMGTYLSTRPEQYVWFEPVHLLLSLVPAGSTIFMVRSVGTHSCVAGHSAPLVRSINADTDIPMLQAAIEYDTIMRDKMRSLRTTSVHRPYTQPWAVREPEDTALWVHSEGDEDYEGDGV